MITNVYCHIPVLIFIANSIKGKFGIKTKEAKGSWWGLRDGKEEEKG